MRAKIRVRLRLKLFHLRIFCSTLWVPIDLFSVRTRLLLILVSRSEGPSIGCGRMGERKVLRARAC